MNAYVRMEKKTLNIILNKNEEIKRRDVQKVFYSNSKSGKRIKS